MKNIRYYLFNTFYWAFVGIVIFLETFLQRKAYKDPLYYAHES